MDNIENNKNINNEEQTQTIELKNLFATVIDMLKLMKKHIVIAVAILVVFVVTAFGYSVFTYEPVYESTATFSIIPLVASDSNNGLSVYKFNYTSTFANQMAKTFPYIVNSRNLEKLIEYDIGRKMTANISVGPVSGSNIIKVSVKSNSAEDSDEILNSFIKCYPQVSEYVFGDTKTNIIHVSDFPKEPVNSSETLKYVLFGFLAGLIIDIVIFFIIAYNRQTIKNKNDVEIKLNSKCICEIPHVIKKRISKNENLILKTTDKNPAFSESIRIMKKRVKSQLKDNEKIIALTSSAFGEGKTTLAYNLSQAFSMGEEKVLLIDFDLKRKNLQNLLGETTKNIYGIGDVVKQKIKLSDAIISKSEYFDVLYSGVEQCKYSDFRIKDILESLREKYDYIVIDLPPCSLISESTLIANLSDVILFTVKSDFASVDSIKSSLQYILYSKARLIGFVVNDCANLTGSQGRYSYYGRYNRYGYGYHYNYK
ncbi:MAG: AAA family ATPase [Acutalibacteraceae bacterium]|nr:AAA family ATPase [Acutalibacteraceae bacterium]